MVQRHYFIFKSLFSGIWLQAAFSIVLLMNCYYGTIHVNELIN